jgi:DegV family protein with EDD domain
MRILTNPGSNLSADEIARYGVYVLPQKVVVDGVEHDTRAGVTCETIDEWVRTARVHPHVLGTSAAEFVEVFRMLAQDDPEIIALHTSRKVIGTHTAALSATRTLAALAGCEHVRVEAVDTMNTDLGAGLCTILACESARAGQAIGQTVEVVARFAEQGVMVVVPQTLDNLVKGGRASFLRAWMANLMNMSPLISFVDGELAAIGKVSRSADNAAAIADALVGRIGAGRSVWCGVAHGGVEADAGRLLALLRKRLDVVHAIERPISASIYLHAGRGCLGAWAYPVDRLPWRPPTPGREGG